MIGEVYYNGTMPTGIESAIKGSATFGTLCGQLTFGILADLIGRKRMYGSELILIIGATLLSALAGNFGHGHGTIELLILWRFVLGFGIGGDYPLSAVIISEFATVKQRGALVASVFAMQGIGILMAAAVAICTLLGYKSAILVDKIYFDEVWRICLVRVFFSVKK